MRNAATILLRDLLERIESGELVVTDCSVSSDVAELPNGAVRPTGEQNFYITTKPGANPAEARPPFGKAVASFAAWVDELASRTAPAQAPALVKRTPTLTELTQAVDTLLDDYQNDRIQRFELFRVGHHLGLAIVKASNQYPAGTFGYARLVQLAARLGRTMYHG